MADIRQVMAEAIAIALFSNTHGAARQRSGTKVSISPSGVWVEIDCLRLAEAALDAAKSDS